MFVGSVHGRAARRRCDCRYNAVGSLPTTHDNASPDGEIGRHKGLKIPRRKAYRFDSGSGHHWIDMIVLDLICISSHRFEGWFASAETFEAQLQKGLVRCPRCGSIEVTRLPSGPHVAKRSPGQMPAKVNEDEILALLQQLAEGSEDVGGEFAEEARRIHFGETVARRIRGVTTLQEAAELLEEGVPVLPLPIPPKDETH
jgi:hypothetical protein